MNSEERKVLKILLYAYTGNSPWTPVETKRIVEESGLSIHIVRKVCLKLKGMGYVEVAQEYGRDADGNAKYYSGYRATDKAETLKEYREVLEKRIGEAV